MKILFFTDLHVGKKQSNSYYLDLDSKVIDSVVSESKKYGVDKIVFGGDFFHDRGDLNQKALTYARRFLDKLDSIGIEVNFILGNHDIYYNSSKEYNYFNIWDGLFKNINFITNMKSDGDILYVAWLQNKKEIKAYDEISNDYKFIFGHFEFTNIKLNENYTTNFGHENKNRKSYIFSGHFHKRMKWYPGIPYPHDWNAKNDEDYGLCLIDTEKETYEFINLNLITYREFSLKEYNKLSDDDIKKFEGDEIRLILDEKISDKELDKIKSDILSKSPKNFIIED